MTAEIAILNKSAVALATDSAVTISAGNQAHKIFDSADKLFELSSNTPIGIMIYNGMQFLGVPLQVLIKEFRGTDRPFETVESASIAFLNYLPSILPETPESEFRNSIIGMIEPAINEIDREIQGRTFELLLSDGYKRELDDISLTVSNEVLARLNKNIKRFGPGTFLGGPSVSISGAEKKIIFEFVNENLRGVPESLKRKFSNSMQDLLLSSYISQAKTGIVFAGFGKTERFPKLYAYEIDGVVGSKIKYCRTEKCDIDRSGERAFIRPFAQKDMVDRFLFGMDDDLRRSIETYCRKTVGEISKSIFDMIDFDNADAREELFERTRRAEEQFFKQLRENAFDSIAATYRREIEAMVEFMPKAELSKMAEALIDLTSIKRKVSRGLETVGGPVDVAVISRSEGFVWVKRKHYFPAELNARFFARISKEMTKKAEAPNDRDAQQD